MYSRLDVCSAVTSTAAFARLVRSPMVNPWPGIHYHYPSIVMTSGQKGRGRWPATNEMTGVLGEKEVINFLFPAVILSSNYR